MPERRDAAAASEIVLDPGAAEAPARLAVTIMAAGARSSGAGGASAAQSQPAAATPRRAGIAAGHNDLTPGGDTVPPAIAAIRAALAPGQRSFSAPRRQRRHAPLSAEHGRASVRGSGLSPTWQIAGMNRGARRRARVNAGAADLPIPFRRARRQARVLSAGPVAEAEGRDFGPASPARRSGPK